MGPGQNVVATLPAFEEPFVCLISFTSKLARAPSHFCRNTKVDLLTVIDKKFATESEARGFVDGKTPTATPSGSSSKGDRFYGVAAGHRPGVYTQWSDAQQQILGFKAPKYRKFSSRQAAAAFVNRGGEVPTETNSHPIAEMDAQQQDTRSTEERASKRSRLSTDTTKSSNLLQVWTDGSSRGNGKEGAVAGVGVWFGEGDER